MTRRSARKGHSASVSDVPQHVPSEDQLCGSCNGDVGDEAIGCDKCETWVCNTEMCSGLPQHMIDSINRYNGAGIQFNCLKCRVSFVTARGDSPSSHTEPHMAETIGQLVQQMKGMCCNFKDLSTKVDAIASRPQPARPATTADHTQTQTQTYAQAAAGPGPHPDRHHQPE